MRRVVVASCVAALAACGEAIRAPGEATSTVEHVNVDFPVGDQCFISIPRPEDCAGRPPCTYADAVLYLGAGDQGLFSLTASPGGGIWMEGVPRLNDPKLPEMVATTPEETAANLPKILAALDAPVLPLNRICVGVFVDQDLRLTDVLAFRDALLAMGVRKVAFANELAED